MTEVTTYPPVTGYIEVLEPIRERIGAVLNLRYEDFDEHCGFPQGLTGKCLGPLHVKRFGIEKFFDAIRGVGLRIRLEEDPEQTAKMVKRAAEKYIPRQANQARMNNSSSPISKPLRDRVYGHFLKEARKKRWVKTSKRERSEHARMMAMARIKKQRKRKKANAKAAKSRAQRLRLQGEQG